MRLVKEHVLRRWAQRKAEVCRDVRERERREKAVRQKLDRLDEAFLFAQSIDIETYDRHKDKLRQELTLLEIDRHEEFDVEGILAFAERVLPRASDLWVQASLDQRQRLQRLFFPDGVVFDGKRFVRTGVGTPAFRYLSSVEPAEIIWRPQRDSNPCFGLERATSWASGRWGPWAGTLHRITCERTTAPSQTE